MTIEAFHEALYRSEEPAKLAKLAQAIDPNGVDKWGRGALAMAAQYGDVKLVELLLARGAKVDGGRTHATPLAVAARRGEQPIVAVLRAAGAKPTPIANVWLGAPVGKLVVDEDGTPIEHHAAATLDIARLDAVLALGGSLAAVDRTRETPLHHAADIRLPDRQEASAAMIAHLIARGAEVDAKTRDDVTPLHQAVRGRNLPGVRVLLAHGADANAADRARGSTPLHRAVVRSGASSTAGTDDVAPAIVALLLEHGADPLRADRSGRTPRVAAQSSEIRKLVGATASRASSRTDRRRS